MGLELHNQLEMAKKYFKHSKYVPILKEAIYCYNHELYPSCEKALAKLPTKEQLLTTLIESLKGKSVYKTLSAINEGKEQQSLKALSSLCTHIAIEIEHGNQEYKALLPNVMEKINEEIYKVLNK